jgi:hypothetical protein
MTSIHPNVSEVLTELEQARVILRHAVEAVPEPSRATRPGEGRWSVNEVLEHLAMVERKFTGAVAMRIAEAKERGLDAERNPREPLPLDLQNRFADRTKRRKAPEAVIPSGTLDSGSAWRAVEEARAELCQLLLSNEGLALSTVLHEHPVFGTLTAYQVAELIAHHERRHAKQIAGIAQE